MNDDTMELSDLRDAWSRLHARFDVDLRRMTAATDALVEDRTRTLVRRAMLPPILDAILAGAAWLVCATGFVHGGTPVFLACLVVMLACLTALLVSSALQIAILARIDAAAPVVTTQRGLGRARAIRIFEWKWVLLTSPVSWTPFLVVAVELPLEWVTDGALLGVFGADFVVGSLLIGAASSLALLWLSRRIATRFSDSTFLRGLLDDLAGRRLVAAQEFLTRLDRFEAD